MSEMNIWNRIKLWVYRVLKIQYTNWGDGQVNRELEHTYEKFGTYNMETTGEWEDWKPWDHAIVNPKWTR